MAEPVSAPRFEMRDVRKAFGATVALDGVDLAVRGGEVCALVGQNGAGKSTLMAILAGALPPDAGVMRLDGATYAPRDPLAARQAGVAMIHQELSLAPDLSVMENIVLGVEPVGGGVAGVIGFVLRQRMRETAIAALAELGHGDIAPECPVGDLSPAAQQLVEIARAIAIGCRVLVLDEPTSSLGHADVQSLFELIGRLKAQGIAIVYISHFIEEVKAVSDRFVVLRDGRNAGDGVTGGTPAEAIVSLMVGRTLDELYPHGTRAAGEPILELDGLVPGAATLTLRRGEILGIAGLLGAGRTRLLRAIFGLEPVRAGRVRVGAYSQRSGPHDRWHQGMGMLSEDRAGEGLALGLSVADNMTLTRLEPFGPAFTVLPSRQDAAAARWVERLGIRCSHPRQTTGQLSGGNQQKVAVGRLLHHDVDVLVLDEPTRGIDVASKAQIYKLIDELVSGGPERAARHGSDVARSLQGREAQGLDVARSFPASAREEDERATARRAEAPQAPRRQGRDAKAVLLVSSYLPELLGVCDRIAVMSRGRLGPARPVEEWTEHSLLMEASGARAS
jgi:ribose transport system ATP-binding protein